MLDSSDELNDLTSWLLILEKIVEQSANMVVITDDAQRIRWVNQTYTRVTGWTLEEVVGKRAGEQLHGPLTDTLVKEGLRNRLKQGMSVSGAEIVNYRKNGESYIALLNIEPIRDNQGKVVAYFSIQSDITEKRSLERANVELQNHLQVAQRLARLGRIESIAQTGMMRWSSVVYSILELAKDEVPKSCDAFFKYVELDAQQEFYKLLRQVLKTGEEFDLEVPLTTRTGQRRWVRCRGVPEQSDGDIQPPRTWTIQDVTLYRELIEQKREMNESLRAMVEERTHHLQAANRSLEAFSHALSHDLKKPVRHMASYAEIVEESLATRDIESAQTYCRKIVAAGKLLQGQIDGLLRFSRMGRQGISPSWVSMTDMVANCLDEVASSFQDRRFQATGVETLPEVLADPVLFREVWVNLIDNAFKYSKPSELTRLDFACSRVEGGWTLSLQDKGRGFNPAMQLHVFEMFGRANSDLTVAGDGIGLALCQRIVLAHGGRIWAETTQDEGSTFFVFLPTVSPVSGFGDLSTSRESSAIPLQRL
ncbi:PAS domain S-box protein [Hydrogenophaga sp.]|uniref:sensor histidine kinase n=1 Tax=Hydrogenophaga sp. TaxID=1904254 RepID=UPI0025BF9B48|nr:PAS domain-containing protein [Hydrogenophaga sp.]MDO9507012.1 PAS domain-containing protein [Hydrogenophaga sp.]MDP3625698.1 PAS domain-containing protein [Hydrogenophaga sp.]